MMILAPVGLGLIFMKETSKRRILYLRAKKRGMDLDVDTKTAKMKKVGNAVLIPLHMCVIEVSPALRCVPMPYR
jgi:hypothetical protein